MDGAAARYPILSDSDRSTLQALSGIVERIGAVVDAETEALRANRAVDLTEVNHRKRQGLLELSRVIPLVSGTALRAEARSTIEHLHEKLERNRTALDVQLRAVREVAEIIAKVMRDAESDGTYSRYVAQP